MNMDKRQKIIAGFLVLAVVVLAWQVYDLLGDGSGSVPVSIGTVSSVKQTDNPAQVMKSKSIEPAQPQVSADQQQYMKLVNEYQMLQMQNMIAQTQASIAKARAETAESIAKLDDLSGSDANIVDLGLSSSNTTTAGNYELIYTGQENGQWTATLKKGGQFNDVTTGSVLPDGTKIISVDDNGVVLVQDKIKKLLTFNGMTTIAAQTPAAPKKVNVVKKTVAETKPVVVTAPKPTTVAKPPVVEKAPTVSVPVLPKVVATHTPMLDITKANKNDYTVQLIAKKNEVLVNQFIDDNKLGGKALSLKIKHNGSLWYIGLYGDFLTVDEANKAIGDLAPTAKTQGPFVRRIGDVQKGVVK